ncbi:Uncharacterised protein [Porphyromonas cangingivalis]|uniref:hypothetical protein n=1 Tax=Porphyromonas cangingivalis TaxID=36874 RepID=UPI000D88FF68|nr:hypothetical protein [Porphyromonas cangingivalis]SPY35395.1 Uncharacterised protein [Porphyromonas cangingivalis]
MKKIFIVLVCTLFPLLSIRGQERKFEYGLQVGTANGIIAQYNLTPKVSLLGEVGLQHRFGATFPRKFYNLGSSPTAQFSARWYFFRPKHIENRGVFLSLGGFYEQSSLSFGYDSKKKLSFPKINWTLALISKVGVEYPIYKSLNIKSSVGITCGSEESVAAIKMGLSDIHTFRNDFVFDLGVSYYF